MDFFPSVRWGISFPPQLDLRNKGSLISTQAVLYAPNNVNTAGPVATVPQFRIFAQESITVTVFLFLFVFKEFVSGVPFVAQQLTNPTRVCEDAGLIPGLAQRVKDPALPWAVVYVADTAQIPLLWLRRRLAAVASTGPLAWKTVSNMHLFWIHKGSFLK